MTKIEKQVNRYIREKSPVVILWSDETGKPVWAVSVKADPEFWLSAFRRLGDAVEFCVMNGLRFEVVRPGKEAVCRG